VVERQPSGLPTVDAETSAVAGAEPAAVGRGATVGRYVILGRVGAGGMGVVYSAYDPDLDRRVAIKLLRLRGASPSRHRARLLREAQALAKLGHPNVVSVYDVGTVGDEVYIAMEFVEGQTLTAWLTDRPRTHAEIVGVFAQAGRGLAAAHDKDFVHRDFKPDNVMVSEPSADDATGIGRVRVMDFGLVRNAGDEPASSDVGAEVSAEPTSASPSGGHAGTAERLTRAGALVGTPAYMAPEQLRSEPAGPAADQFSFCVAMWEALYGELPFGDGRVEQVAAAVFSGGRPTPPSGSAVPAWLRRVVERGLATEPSERWPSMRAVLRELQADPSRRDRWLAVGAAAVVAAGALGLWLDARQDHGIALCEAASEAVHATWTPDRRAALTHAFVQTGWAAAEKAAAATATRFDTWAEAWARDRKQSCLAERAGDLDPALDAAGCFEARRAALEATLSLLEEGRREDVFSAVVIAIAAPKSDACVDVDRLRRQPRLPTDPVEREAALERRAALVRVVAAYSAGRFEDAIALAEQTVQRATAADSEVERIEAMVHLGEALATASQFPPAIEVLTEAYLAAKTTDEPELRVRAATSLVTATTLGPHEYELARLWARLAEADRAPSDFDAKISIDLARGAAARGRGDHQESEQLYERAIEALGTSRSSNDVTVATARVQLGATLLDQGKYARAERLNREAVASMRAALGSASPKTLVVETNLGQLLHLRGADDEAYPLVANALTGLVDALGPDHPWVQASRGLLAVLELERGDPARSVALHRDNLQSRQRTDGLRSLPVGLTRINLGQALGRGGDPEAAEAEYRTALDVLRDALHPEHPRVSRAAINLGRLLAEQGRSAEAREILEDVVVRLRDRRLPRGEMGEAQFALALALWDEKEHRERARQLAAEASADYGTAGSRFATEKRTVDEWLDQRK
jgi:tetratricopeptide (TPR) repeat protein